MAFDPTLLSSLNYWYKADSITGVTDNTKFPSWLDSGPGVYSVQQATSANQPTYFATSGPGGLPYVSFGGSALMVGGGDSTYLNAGLTIFAVVNPNQLTANATIVGGNVNVGGGWAGLRTSTTGLLDLEEANRAAVGVSTRALSKAAWQIVATTFANTGQVAPFAHYVNGYANGSGISSFVLGYAGLSAAGSSTTRSQQVGYYLPPTVGPSNLNFPYGGTVQPYGMGALPGSVQLPIGLAIGSKQSALSEPWNGGIAEVVSYRRVLDANELNQVFWYLSQKYSITVANQLIPQRNFYVQPLVQGPAAVGPTFFAGNQLQPATPSSGIQYLNTLVAGLNFAGQITKSYVSGGYTASLNFTGSSVKSITRNLSAGVSFAGSTIRSTGKGLSGGVSFAGSIARSVVKSLTAAANFTGTFPASFIEAIAIVFQATLGFTGNTTKGLSRIHTAALNFVGAMASSRLKVMLFNAVLSLTAGGSSPTPTFVQLADNFSSGSATSLTATMGSNVTIGDLIVVAVGWAAADTAFNVTDSQGNTYTQAAATSTGIVGYASGIYYTVATATGALTVTLTRGSAVGFIRMGAFEYSGVNALDVGTANSGNSGNPSVSFTSTHATELQFAWILTNSTTPTAPSGWTTRDTIHSEIVVDNIVTSIGSYTPTGGGDGGPWQMTSAAAYSTLASAPGFFRSVGKALSAVLTTGGTLSRGITRGLQAGLSFTGSATKSLTRNATAALNFTGTMSSSRLKTIVLTAVLAFSGSVNRATTRSLAGVLSFSGTIGRRIAKGFSATLAFGGTLGRSIARSLSATLTPGGTIGKALSRINSAVLNILGFLGVIKSHAHNTDAPTGTWVLNGSVVESQTEKSTPTGLMTLSGTVQELNALSSQSTATRGGTRRQITEPDPAPPTPEPPHTVTRGGGRRQISEPDSSPPAPTPPQTVTRGGGRRQITEPDPVAPTPNPPETVTRGGGRRQSNEPDPPAPAPPPPHKTYRGGAR